uniref:Photoactivated adenylate cyclase subunit alpha n=1 Tax=Euglena gracilis TaxID=3039 RepID=PCYAA_EUGGR|nr:RecName: Full=Photoactivated adenylate cyclase subunit alpha; AltName: Full=Photoactivated adenylyl cyclase subunit alpha [Euglena gracilis]BAB85619.1 alpha subunit of photoactivated adenylyl cyclase [Euglena gracilis]CAJ57393.1 photoactivated adenylate cyclase-like protein, alpha subunit [Euglena gracilis]
MYILVWKEGQQIRTFQDLEECGQFQTASNITDGQIFSINVTPTMSKGGETGETQLRRLMYLSASTEPEKCNAEYLADMAHVATLRNKQIGVSGFLLYSSPFFFQVIEGTDEDLDFLFAKISADPRHERCIVLANGPCTGRMYGEWHMKDSHIDNITKHPAIKTILFQIARSFSSMWSYLPKNAANMLLLGKNPNKQAPEPMSVVVTFIYLVEFSSILAHPGLTEQCADILAAFVDACVRNVEGTGGQVAKFITGICMAYWPINRAEDALVGLQQLSEDLAELRSQQPPGSALSLIYSRCGVHYGRALLCNAGFRKADFTLLGDCINTASRITSLSVKLKVPLLLSFEVRCLLGDEMREELESSGLHKVKGRDKPVQVYQFNAPELDSAMVRAKIEQFNPGRYRALCPVKPYESLHPAQRPPIFDDTPRENQPKLSQVQRRDSLVDRLSLIAKLAFPSSMMAGGEGQLITLTYISQAAHPMSRLDLASIQRIAFARNESSNITGSLLYVSGLFVQTLEGPKGAVVSLYLKIRQDKRHKDVVAVFMAPIDERVYGSPLDMTSATEEMLATFPPLQDVLSQLAKSFISLETYVPSTVVRYLTAGNNPRNLQPVSVEVVMLATDICSFTPLSEKCSLTEVWTICNTFIDACTSAICNEGGEVIKLIGDCVTAYFPPTGADNAVHACQEIVSFCAQLRDAFHDVLDCRSVVACGVGLDFGQVIMAQCGSLGMTEFVVAGEVSARVMEVEALTREAGRAIVITEPVADRLSPKLRDTGIVPCQEGVDGVPCYGILGPEWELDVATIKKNIYGFHDARALAAMKKVDDGTNAPGRGAPAGGIPSSPKVRPPGRTNSVSSYTPDPNEALDPRMAESVFLDMCHQRGDTANNSIAVKLRQAANDDRLDLGRMLQGPHELMPVMQAIKHLTNLRMLNMSDNFVDDNNVGELVESCIPMRSLQVLDLSNNPGLTKVIALKRLIKHNTQVREILLNGTRIAPTEQRKLQSSMNVNRLCASTDLKGSHKYEH